MTTWFTSDHHFKHRKILRLCKRPFKSVAEMENAMINNWNGVVADDDTVYHFGDFCLGGHMDARLYFSQLKGHIRILSNPWHHDKKWLTSFFVPVSASGVGVMQMPPMVVLELKEYEENGYPKPLVLCHYPIAQWDRKHYGSWHLYGHPHGNYHYPPGTLAIDVSVDNTNFTPVSLEWVAEQMRAIEAGVSPDLDSDKGVDDGIPS